MERMLFGAISQKRLKTRNERWEISWGGKCERKAFQAECPRGGPWGGKELGVFEKLICGLCGRNTETEHQDGRNERRERGKQAQCCKGLWWGVWISFSLLRVLNRFQFSWNHSVPEGGGMMVESGDDITAFQSKEDYALASYSCSWDGCMSF